MTDTIINYYPPTLHQVTVIVRICTTAEPVMIVTSEHEYDTRNKGYRLRPARNIIVEPEPKVGARSYQHEISLYDLEATDIQFGDHDTAMHVMVGSVDDNDDAQSFTIVSDTAGIPIARARLLKEAEEWVNDHIHGCEKILKSPLIMNQADPEMPQQEWEATGILFYRLSVAARLSLMAELGQTVEGDASRTSTWISTLDRVRQLRLCKQLKNSMSKFAFVFRGMQDSMAESTTLPVIIEPTI